MIWYEFQNLFFSVGSNSAGWRWTRREEMARSSPTSWLLPTSGGGKWRWDFCLHFFMEILFEETFFLEFFEEELFCILWGNVFGILWGSIFGILWGIVLAFFVVIIFFGLFQEFLAFFEEMIFSILWRKSLFVCICHEKCTGWSDKKANWGLWTWEDCEGKIILLLVNGS